MLSKETGLRELFAAFATLFLLDLGAAGFLLVGLLACFATFWNSGAFTCGLRRGFFAGGFIVPGDDFAAAAAAWAWACASWYFS